jgi:hypothetical protein
MSAISSITAQRKQPGRGRMSVKDGGGMSAMAGMMPQSRPRLHAFHHDSATFAGRHRHWKNQLAGKHCWQSILTTGPSCEFFKVPDTPV